MKEFKYILEPYKGPTTKHRCPACGKKNFVRYIDGSGNYLHPEVGRCDRESKCSHHLTPKQYFDRSGLQKPVAPTTKRPEPVKPFKYISIEAMKASMAEYKSNNFMLYLRDIFGSERALSLAKIYNIGTSKKWPGANIFYQLDLKGRVRRGKVMLYNLETGKRDHSRNHSVHAISGIADQKPPESFFGEHLIPGSNKRIAIVEAEKTALIASIYLPEFTWIACGGLSMLSYEKCKALAGRDVLLWPDLGGFKLWQEKAGLLLPKIARSWKVSDFLEKRATPEEKEAGLDLADYLIRYRPEQFAKPTQADKPLQITKLAAGGSPAPSQVITAPAQAVEPQASLKEEVLGENTEDLISFFETAQLPQSIQLDSCSFISDVPAFVQSHLSIAQNASRISRPYVDRLQTLKFILQNGNT